MNLKLPRLCCWMAAGIITSRVGSLGRDIRPMPSNQAYDCGLFPLLLHSREEGPVRVLCPCAAVWMDGWAGEGVEYNGHRYFYAASEGESEVLCCVYLSGFDEGGRGTGSNESKEEGRRTSFSFQHHRETNRPMRLYSLVVASKK